MTEVGITALLVVLLIAVFMFFKKRKNCSSCCSSKETPKSKPKAQAQEQVKQQPEIKSPDKPVVVNVETASVNPQISDTTVVSSPEPKPANQPTVNIEPSAKPQAKEVECESSSLPQDSILKRHYLTHVCTMIESLAPPRPTDSVLCRHYDAMIVTQIDQCLNDKKAMEQLIHAYENKK